MKEQLINLQARFKVSQVLLVSPEEHALTKERITAYLQDPADDEDYEDSCMPVVQSPLSIIPVFGELMKGTGLPQEVCQMLGICDLDDLSEDIKEAGSDPNVNCLVLWFRSPGGGVTGVKELANLINTISQNKPVIAYTDTLCASAAYWLASQCSAIITSDTAKIGNVGCYVERYDLTEQNKMMGVKVDVIKDGDYKTDGNPNEPMTKEEEANIQSRVSAIADDFRNDITNKRSIDDSLLQGQIFMGEEAVSNGFADGSMPDLQTTLLLLVPVLLSDQQS